MAAPTRRGQVLTEFIWSVLLIVSFATFLMRLHWAALEAQQKPRWEIQKRSMQNEKLAPSYQ